MSATMRAAPETAQPFLTAMEVGFGLWRILWFELPLAWLSEIDRFTAAVAETGGSMAPALAVALGLGCSGAEDTGPECVLALDQGRQL